ncbi:cellulose binding domain-containing protein [Spirillospora sp. NPDC049652]
MSTPGATPPATGDGGGGQPGPAVQGNGISYQIVQQSQGYFEGQFTVTNPGTAPLSGWKITFTTPRADVHAIWGAELVHGGTQVEIRGTSAIPPGGSTTIRFGATGLPARPEGCRLSGRPCGF